MTALRELIGRITGPFSDFYEGLPSEKKVLVEYGTIAVISIMVALIVIQGYRKIGKTQENLAKKYVVSRSIFKNLSLYRSKEDLVDSLKAKLSQVKGGFSLISYLERNALKANISKSSIDRIDPKEVPGGELVKRINAEIQLLNITLKQLVDFLYYIESSPYPLATSEVRIVTRFDNKDFLDSSIIVAFAQPRE